MKVEFNFQVNKDIYLNVYVNLDISASKINAYSEQVSYFFVKNISINGMPRAYLHISIKIAYICPQNLYFKMACLILILLHMHIYVCAFVCVFFSISENF